MERSLSFRSHSPSSSSRLNATLNIKHAHSETTEAIPMSADGTYTFTSTLPMPPSPALAATLSSSGFAPSSPSSSSSSSMSGAYKKVTTIRAPKRSPIIINLSSDSMHDLSNSGPVLDAPSPRPASAAAVSPSHYQRFASTAPIGKAAESSTRAELAKETRARMKAQQRQREEHEVHRQQEEGLERENRSLRRQLSDASAELDSVRQQLAHSAQAGDIAQQRLLALEADKDREVAGLLRELENNIRQWEAERAHSDAERADMRQQQVISDLAVTGLQERIAELESAVYAEEAERRRVKGWWMDAQKQVGVLEDEVRVWRGVQTEERQRHAEIIAEYEQIRTAYTGLVSQQLQQQHEEQPADTAADTAEGAAEGREEPGVKFSRASIVAPLLSPVQQVSSHVNESAAEEAKYEDGERDAEPPMDEQITAIVVEQAAQATQQLESANSALHRHVRQLSKSHLQSEAELRTQLDAFQAQSRQLLEDKAGWDRRMEAAVQKHKALWKQLGQQMNENALVKRERDGLKLSLAQLSSQLASLQTLRGEEERKHAELLDVLKGELGGAEESVKRSTAVYMDYLNRLTDTQRQLTDAQATIAQQAVGAERSGALISQLTMQLAERRQEADRRELELQEATTRAHTLKASVEQLNAEMAARREASEQMERQLSAQLFDLRGQQQWAKLASEHDAATIASLRTANTHTVRQWQSQQRQSNKQLASVTAERDFLSVQLAQAEECRADLCDSIQQLESDKAEAEGQAQRTQTDNRQLHQQLQHTTGQLREQNQHCAALQAWMADDQQQAHQQAAKQKALRAKLGSLVDSKRRVIRRVTREKREMESVLKASLSTLRRNESRRAALDGEVAVLRKERDEFDAILHGALRELQAKEQAVADLSHDMEERQTVIEQLYRDKQAAADSAARSQRNLQADIAALTRQKAELHSVLLEALSELRRREAQLLEGDERDEEVAALLSRTRAEKAELTEVLRQVVATLAGLEDAYRRTVDDAQRTEREREQYASVYEDALAELRRREEEISAMGAEEDRLQSEVSRASAGKQELSDVLRSAVHSLSAVESKLETAARENEQLSSSLNASVQQRTQLQSETVELNTLIAKHERLSHQQDQTIRELYETIRRQEADGAAQRENATAQHLAAASDELSRMRTLCAQQQAIIEQLTALRDELQRLVAELLAGRHDAARAAEAQVELARVQADVEVRDGLTRELKRAHDELVRVEAERVAEQRQAEQMQSELSDTQSRLAEKERQLQASRDEESRLQREACESAEERDSLTAALSSARAESARLSAEQDELSGRASELEARLHQSALLCSEMQALQQSRESLIATLLQQCDGYKAAAEEDSAARQTEQATHSSQLIILQSRVAELNGRYEAVQAAIKRVEAERDSVEGQLRDVSRQHEQDAGHLQQAITDLDAVTAQNKDAAQQLNAAQHTIEGTAQQLQEATRAKRELDGVLREVLSTLAAKEQQAQSNEAGARQLRSHLGALIAAQQARKLAGYRSVAELNTVLRQVVQRLNAREAELQSCEMHVSLLQSEHATLTDAVLKADEELQAAQSKLGEGREQLRLSKARAGEDAQEIARQTEQISRLRAEVQSKADEVSAAQEQLEQTAGQLATSQHEAAVAQQQAKAASYREEERRVRSEGTEDKLRELHIQINIAQQEVKDKDRTLGDTQRLRSHTQQQLEEAQHQIQLLTDSLTSAAAAAEGQVAQQSAREENEERVRQLEGVIDGRNGELSALEAQLHALQTEFARHNSEDHAQMNEQSEQWQAEQDALKDECKQLGQQLHSTRQQLGVLSAQHEQAVHELSDNQQQLAQAEQQRVEKGQEVALLQSQLTELRHTHNGGSNDIALNAIIECQSATLEAQLAAPATPTSPASSSSTTPSSRNSRARPSAVDAKTKVDPMVKVLQANHKKELATLEKQLEKAHCERRVLEKKVRELEKKSDSLHTLKSQAEYRQKDISEHERTQQARLTQLERGMEEAVKERTRLAVECADVRAKFEQATVDRERVLATEKEREDARQLREKQWSEERSRLEQRIAALNGKGGAATHRRKKSGSSVTFKDDAALHVGDLRYEISELQHENSKLLSTIQRLSSSSQYAQQQQHETVREEEEVKDMDEEIAEEEEEYDSSVVSYEPEEGVAGETGAAPDAEEAALAVAEAQVVE